MGRNTEIYTFNKEKAKQNLLPFISDQVLTNRSFIQFLNKREREYGSVLGTSADQLARVISENINFIRPDNFLQLMFFLNNEIIYPTPVPEKNIDDYGIMLLYELPTTTVCTGYMFQYGNYTHHYPVEDLGGSDCGVNISAEDFSGFNAYMILLTRKILDSRIDGNAYTVNDFTEPERKIYEKIRLKFSENEKFQNIVEEEFLHLKKSFINDNSGPDAQTIYYASTFFSTSIMMHQKITRQNRVLILDY